MSIYFYKKYKKNEDASTWHPLEDFVLILIHDIFNLPDRQIKFFGQRLVTDPIQKPPLQDSSVTLTVDVLVNQARHI